jgi:hypothetical protein
MKKYLIFLFLFFSFTGIFARKPAKHTHKVHTISQKHPKFKAVAAPKLTDWQADFVWQITENEPNKNFKTKLSQDKELKNMIKYIYHFFKRDTTAINFSFLESEVEKPVAALQANQRFVLYNPQKLNVDLYGPHIAGIVYQIGHHYLGHTAQTPEKQAILEADSFYAHCITSVPALVAAGHGRKLLDSLPETAFKKQRIAAFQKGIDGGKEARSEQMSEERKLLLAAAKARAAKQKRFYVFVFILMVATLLGLGYRFRIKH